MSTENKYAIALGVLCVLLLLAGSLFARVLSRAEPRTIRVVWPIAALVTGGVFATFVYVARMNAH